METIVYYEKFRLMQVNKNNHFPLNTNEAFIIYHKATNIFYSGKKNNDILHYIIFLNIIILQFQMFVIKPTLQSHLKFNITTGISPTLGTRMNNDMNQ